MSQPNNSGQIRGSASSVGSTAAVAVQSFVSSGGGLLIAAQTWYYGESGHPINQALNKMVSDLAVVSYLSQLAPQTSAAAVAVHAVTAHPDAASGVACH